MPSRPDAAGADAASAPDGAAAPIEIDVPHPDHAVRVRGWRATDARSLAIAANHPEVPRYLRDRFPHPYTLDDAESFLTHVALPAPALFQAIEVDGHIAGGIGFAPGSDVERHVAELGYWLTPPASGRGIMTAIVRAYVPLLFEQFCLQRVWSKVYAPNVASMRVLERSGFRREGLLRNAVTKQGQVLDAILYARIPGDAP
jgi:ribosomal-protein-alanine N-acetyltransferase